MARRNAGNPKNTEKKAVVSDLSKMADTDKVTIVSESRAGKTVIGVEPTPVVFDADGKAEVSVKEAKYFLTIPGFELEDTETDGGDTGNGSGAPTGGDASSGGDSGQENGAQSGESKQ